MFEGGDSLKAEKALKFSRVNIDNPAAAPIRWKKA